MRARRRTRRGRAASASRSTGRCSRASIRAFRSCCRAGSMPAMSPRHLRITRAPRRRCLLGRRARARRKGPRQDPRLHPRRARGRSRASPLESEMQRMTAPQPNSFRTGPDERGHFGIYGGRFVAETLMPLILDLEKAYAAAKADPKFQEGDGRPSRDTMSAGRRRSISPSGSRSIAAARKSISSARSSTTPARTR